MKFDWMKETIMPDASAAVRYTVPPFGGLPWPKSCARFGSMSFDLDFRYSLSSSACGRTSMWSMSPT